MAYRRGAKLKVQHSPAYRGDMDMSRFNINQLTKEMVCARLMEIPDPCDAAADIMKRTILVTLSGAPKPLTDAALAVVSDIVQGAMTGLILKEQDLIKGTLAALHKANEAALELSADPTIFMQAAMRGIADLRRFTERAKMDAVARAIDAEFMGAGQVFVHLLETPLPETKAV